jgi:RNA polymerase sigma-19 factor, ECF subfamily
MRPADEYTDAELVALLNQGDRKAFEIIYRKYVYELLQFARKNIPVQEECEEIVQEVFTSIWARHRELKIQALRVYLFSMVKFMTVKYFQRQTLRRRYSEHYKLFEALYDDTIQESFDSPSVREKIERSLASLPERCQTAIRLRLNENLSNGDIARRMKVTKKTVANYVVMFTSHFRNFLAKAEARQR